MTENETTEKQEKRIPVVAIVGRPNVGKSSLFNAIVGRRVSIVHEQPGVTRDRVVAPASWHGKHFQLIDTGGLGNITGAKKMADIWDAGIREQVEAAIEGADVLIFVCNVQDGIVPLDREVTDRLRGIGKKVLLAANKCDNPTLDAESMLFSELGFDKIYPVSCLHRKGVARLLDIALEDFEDVEEDVTTKAEPFRIAVVGRPNVGKSSMVNWMLGEERVMVSDIAGTTRDSIDIDFEIKYKGEMLPAALIDTAGLRKRSKIDNVVELFSMMRTEEALKRAQLVLFLVETSKDGVTSQDRKIAASIVESGKGCIIVANKFDLCKDEDEDVKQKQLIEEIRYTLPHLNYAPVVFTSVLRKYNMNALLDQIAEVMAQMEVKIPTSLVNKVLLDAFARNSPPVVGVAPLKLYYCSMIGSEPPKFLLFVNQPVYCADNYLIFLKNCLRQAFDFTGLPIVVELRARPKKVESIRTERTTDKFRKPAGKIDKRNEKKTLGKPEKKTDKKPGKKPGKQPGRAPRSTDKLRKSAAKPGKKAGSKSGGGPEKKRKKT
ncbi:MAG: ribosome biogenesis GTPase Der [Victivallaceae bacterium]|jgi:GTP-binding protein